MPEGDTIHRTAAALRAALLGRPMTAFEAPRLRGLQPTIGAVIERVDSRGKHLEIGWDDGVVLHTHMRMSGSWHLYRPGERWRKAHGAMRVVIEVDGWQAVCFSAPVVETYRSIDFTHHPGLGTLGPDLVRPDADLHDCVARVARFCEAETTVAEALLDQRIACGVGNVYKSEVLWACELHPFTPVGALDESQRRALIDTAARLLRANLDGPARVTVPGTPDGLAVYGRFGKPCLRCGTPIEVRKHGEQARVTYWCPGCQLYLPLPEPDEAAADGLDEGDDAGRGLLGRWRRRRARQAAPGADDGTPDAGDDAYDDTYDGYDGYDGTCGEQYGEHGGYHGYDDQPDGDTRDERGSDAFADLDVLDHDPSPVPRYPDPHPAARTFLAGRPGRLEPSYVDPLLARRPDA